jgi:hypothetical protein
MRSDLRNYEPARFRPSFEMEIVMRNNGQAFVRSRPARPREMVEGAVQRVRKYLLHRHLAHWHPISTAPHNQDLELRIVDNNGVVTASFPCRRTNTGVWINADLGTSLHIQPTAWRLWQNKSLQSAVFGSALVSCGRR